MIQKQQLQHAKSNKMKPKYMTAPVPLSLSTLNISGSTLPKRTVDPRFDGVGSCVGATSSTLEFVKVGELVGSG